MRNNHALIELRHIFKRYTIGDSQIDALKDISLQVQKGDLVAIVGASGSGKSTLMNILGLLDTQDQGQFLLHGQDVSGLNDTERATLRNHSIGFVFQQFNLLPRFTALQNIALPLIYRGMNQDLINQQAHQALAHVNMAKYANHKPTQLSGGQQQRIAIARSLVAEPELILADEPTGALDSQTGHEIMSLFLSLNQEGRTLIIITHDDKVASLCTRRIHLSDGEIKAVEPS